MEEFFMFENKSRFAVALTVSGLTLPLQALATDGYFPHGFGVRSQGIAGRGFATGGIG
jgi:hypothetical protein